MTFWDDNATPEGVFNVGDMYDEYTRRQADFIVEQLDVDEGWLVDLGCGIGRLATAVLDLLPDVDVEGYDTSMRMLDEAGRREPRLFLSHAGDLADYSRLTDGAWSVLTFQHLPDVTVKGHLESLYRALKPGARLVTQWVTSGEEGPMSYPRDGFKIAEMYSQAGFEILTACFDELVTGYADNWLWVVAEKPA